MRSLLVAAVAAVALLLTNGGCAEARQHRSAAPAPSQLNLELPQTSLLFQRVKASFSTASLHHVEPVLDFRVVHEDNAHLHSLETRHPTSQHPLKVGNAANSIGAHSLRMRKRNGHKQPFPETISLAFRAFDQEFNLPNMQLDAHTFAPHATHKVTDEMGNTVEHQMTLSTYRGAVTEMPVGTDPSVEADVVGWAVATLTEDGLLTAIIHTNRETWQVDPLFVHEHGVREHAGEETHHLLLKHAVHNMVLFRHSDAKHLGIDKETGKPFITCGAVKSPGPDRDSGNSSVAEPLTPDDIIEHPEPISANKLFPFLEDAEDPSSVATMRRLLLDPGVGVTRWTNCYTGDNIPKKLSHGVAVDYGFFAKYGTMANVEAAIANIYAAVNAVYQAQFNLYVQIGETLIKSDPDTTLGWNWKRDDGQKTCRTDQVADINAHLTQFTTWRKTVNPTNQGTWHLLTDCWTTGSVGLAYLGAICLSRTGTGLSSWTATTWLTVAHEIGHNLNSQHSFQEGQGTTGGIMDYGEKQYPLKSGIYQFHPTYCQPPICQQIQSALTITGFTPFCIADYAPVCGNGVVESGETCDDKSACCKNCQLVGQCTPGKNNANPCCTASCTYLPTTTTCNNGMGYCSNGRCTDAICYGYGMPLCGFDGGCKIKCGGPPSASPCSQYYTSPDLKLADGLVCNTTTYSTCSAGKCVASTPAVTYSWSIGTSSACSCSGVQTRTVSCKGSDGSSAPDASCPGAKPATTSSCAVPSSCYVWQQSAWSACSVDCGNGVQTASVSCVQAAGSPNPGAVVSSAQCNGTAPATQRVCMPKACPTAWTIGEWSASCTVSCGTGTQSRTVVCQQTQNGAKSNVGDSFCPQPKPATSQNCNTQVCQDGQWSYSSWSSCSATCGGGTQTRSVSCVNAATGVAYPDNSHCQSAGAIAATSQTCNTGLCPSYEWYAASWSACSVTCGTGTQTRSVNCYDKVNDPTHTEPANTNLCTFAQPVSQQSCTQPACVPPPNYQWVAGSWGTCSVSCGGGSASRTVQCVNTVDNVVQTDESRCSGAGTKPATTQTCSPQGCPVYVWAESGFGSCSVECGSGVQTQTVACKDQATGTAVANTKCSGTAPATSRTCNTVACPPAAIPHTWKQGAGSPCSVQCNGGTQTFTPKCYRTDTNVVVDDSVCADQPKPATSGACNTQSCPTFWSTKAWSVCSASCGPSGTQTRQVGCFYSTDNVNTATPLPDSRCSGSKPATMASCNSFACPTWQPSSAWSVCSASCNVGTQTRTIGCQNYDGTSAPDSACAGAVAPTTTQTCQIIPCPHWHRNLWSDCSKPCADSFGPGIQNRSVICRMPHDDPKYYGIEAARQDMCSLTAGDTGDGEGEPGVANGKPPSMQQCNTDSCPTYFWQLGEPGACSATCGGGLRTATVRCVNSRTGAVASNNLCPGTKPSSTFACNTWDCPVYVWNTTDWGACSSFCATGVQTRQVRCRNLKPDPSVKYNVIDVDPSYCASLGPTPPSERACTAPEDVCWGSEYQTAPLFQKNGRCDTAANACVCRSPWFGVRCTQTDQITNVQTNGAVFGAAGVPLGQPLLISWSSSKTATPRVDVLLAKEGADPWPAPQYLAVGIQNTNAFTWTVGNILKSGLEPGSEYRVLVWASRTNFANSAKLTIADPCAYVTCGANGVCAKGGVCACSAGYSGPTCAIGPCEAAQCNMEYSTCNNTRVISTGQYLTDNVCKVDATSSTCLSGWTGAQCRTPPACAAAGLHCAHGGDLDGVVEAGTSCSGTCACRGLWAGPTCEKCGLTCQHGGKPVADCTQCTQCNAGWFGRECECKYYVLSFRFGVDVRGWYDATQSDPEKLLAQARWSKTLSLDLLQSVATVTAQPAAVIVDKIRPETSADGTPRVYVEVRLSLDCASVAALGAPGSDLSAQSRWSYSTYSPVMGPSADDMAYITHEKLALPSDNGDASGGAARRLLQSLAPGSNVTGTLLETYTALAPLLSDLSSIVYQGQVTSQADASWTVTASDPSGESALLAPLPPRDCFETDCSAGTSGGGGDDGGSGSKSIVDKVMSSTLWSALFLAGCVVVLALIIVVIVLAVRRHRAKGSAASTLMRLGGGSIAGGTEMVSNPALERSIHETGRWHKV